jgi:streptogramin lyase
VETDEQIRSHLTRTPGDVPAFEPRVDHVLRRARARRRRRLVGASGVAVLLVAGVGVPLGMLSGLRGPSKPSPADMPPLVRPVFEARIHVPTGAVDVMVGDGAVWESGFGKVSRIDPQTNEVVTTIDTPGTEDYSRVAVGEGSVWVTADGGKLYRIDPATNTVVATIQVGGPLIGVVATGEGSVWVTRPSNGAGELVRIDPATNAVVGEPIEVGPGPVSVVSDLGALWVTNTSPPSVVRVDPVSGEVRTVGSVTGDLVVAYGSLWAASDDQVVRADPETGQPIETFRIPRAAAVATSEGQVWVLAMPESSSPTLFYPIKGTAALWQIDPADSRIVGEPVRIDALQPIALAAGEGAVWVADYVGATVTRFGLVPCSDTVCGETTQTVCSASEALGDFDGDGSTDTANLHAVGALPESDCGPQSLEEGWRFRLAVAVGSNTFTVPFDDCINPPDCQLLPGSDFDGDGRDELVVTLSATSSSVSAIYRITVSGIHPLEFAAPGDPGFLEPGPVRLGGHQTSIMGSGFECRLQDDGSRVLVAWSAERDDGASPYRMHLTTLELDGDIFTVIGTEDQQDVTVLPPRQGMCA